MFNKELTLLLTPILSNLGLECLGVEYSPSHGNGLVRVYIDAPQRAVTVNDCEVASRQISATLDVNDPIPGRYTLEVSSPGVDRPLFTPEQFARCIGQAAKAEVNLAIDGRRRFQGSILAVEGADVILGQDGIAVRIAHANIHRAKLAPQHDEPTGKSGKHKQAKKSK